MFGNIRNECGPETSGGYVCAIVAEIFIDRLGFALRSLAVTSQIIGVRASYRKFRWGRFCSLFVLDQLVLRIASACSDRISDGMYSVL